MRILSPIGRFWLGCAGIHAGAAGVRIRRMRARLAAGDTQEAADLRAQAVANIRASERLSREAGEEVVA